MAGLSCVILLYLAAAFVGAFVPGRTAAVAAGDDATAILVAGPIHYDLLLPATPETLQAFAFLDDIGVPLDGAGWIVVGWGSRAFYTATGRYQDMAFGPVMRAVTGDSAVFRFDVAYGDLAEYGEPIQLSDAQFARLRGQILQGLQRDDAGAVNAVQSAGFTSTDIFIEAKGHFSILRTCNVWIGEILRGAGVKMGVWTPTPYAVTLSRWWFG